MKRVLSILFLLLACGRFVAADTPWEYGRIVSLKKSVNTRTQAWVVNTPITEEETLYTIVVHMQDKIVTGDYKVGPGSLEPPEEWKTNYPVRAQILGDNLFLRAPTGDVKLRITQRKPAPAMAPLTAEERTQLDHVDVPVEAVIGPSESSSRSGATADNVPSHSAPEDTSSEVVGPQLPAQAPTTGSVMVRSTPYLSEVGVDGDSMGYTPARINLPPGKHTFRIEKLGYKPWIKEIMVTAGSELTLDATLEKK